MSRPIRPCAVPTRRRSRACCVRAVGGQLAGNDTAHVVALKRGPASCAQCDEAEVGHAATGPVPATPSSLDPPILALKTVELQC
jgi:hypothetical protein